MSETTTKKKGKKIIPAHGRAVITSGFNNTLITLADLEGNTLFSASAGGVGFKGTRKSTPYAAATAASSIADKAVRAGLKEVAVFVKGPGSGRDAAIKSLKNAGLEINSITDITPIPHNGVRPRKRRRV